MAEQRVPTLPDLIHNIEDATKIARLLHEKYLVLDQGVLNSKFTDLVALLNTAKEEISDFQNIVKGKDKEISDLKSALNYKGELKCVRDAYYQTDEEGKPFGQANCIHCWENNFKKRTLVTKHDDPQVKICPTCGKVYARSETETLPKKKKFNFFKFFKFLKKEPEAPK